MLAYLYTQPVYDRTPNMYNCTLHMHGDGIKKYGNGGPECKVNRNIFKKNPY